MGFLGKQCFFLKSNVFTRLHTWFILIIKHIKIKTIYVLHKLSFYNTIPHRRHSLIGHVIKNSDKISSVLHFSTLKLILFSCRKSLRFLSAHILKLCVFSQKCAWKTQTKNYHWTYICLTNWPDWLPGYDLHMFDKLTWLPGYDLHMFDFLTWLPGYGLQVVWLTDLTDCQDMACK